MKRVRIIKAFIAQADLLPASSLTFSRERPEYSAISSYLKNEIAARLERSQLRTFFDQYISSILISLQLFALFFT